MSTMIRYVEIVTLACLGLGLTGCGNVQTRLPDRGAITFTAAEPGTTDTQASTASATADPSARLRFDAALALMESGKTQQALSAFQTLSKDYPQLAGSFVNLGILYADSNQTNAAIAALKRAVSINPDNAAAFNWLGIMYRRIGQFTQAEHCYRKALTLQPGYAAAHLNLGILDELSLRRPQEAASQYREYLRSAGSHQLIVTAWIKELETSTATTTPILTGSLQ